jgi:hypothetical protein
MPEEVEQSKPTSSIRKCWKYWRSSLREAKEAQEMVAWILTVVCAIVGLIAFAEGDWTMQTFHISAPVIQWGAWGLSVILFIRTLIWLPFRRHEAQETYHAETIGVIKANHTAEVQSIKASYQALKETASGLEAKLNDRDERIRKNKAVDEALGNLQKHHEDRLWSIRRMGYYKYMEELQAKEGKDVASEFLMNTTHNTIEADIGHAEAAFYRSIANQSKGPYPEQGIIFPAPTSWHHMIDLLQWRIKQLNTIIEKRMSLK